MTDFRLKQTLHAQRRRAIVRPENEDVMAELEIRSDLIFTDYVLRCAFHGLNTKETEYDQLLPVFLDHGNIALSTNEISRGACSSFDRMAFLISCHGRGLSETEELLEAAAKLDSDILMLVLRHTVNPKIEESMIKSAATSKGLQALLRHTHIVTPPIIKTVLRNSNFDKSCLELLESRFGTIHANLDIPEAAAVGKHPWVGQEVLLRRGADVTEDSIVLVAQDYYSDDTNEVMNLLELHLANNPAVQISQELVERIMSLRTAMSVMEVLMKCLTPAFKAIEYIMHRADYFPNGKAQVLSHCSKRRIRLFESQTVSSKA